MLRQSGPASRVLVTGLSGFTGSYLAEELDAAGLAVIGDSQKDATAVRAQDTTFDITSLDQCQRVIDDTRPDYLVHLAAISFFTGSMCWGR